MAARSRNEKARMGYELQRRAFTGALVAAGKSRFPAAMDALARRWNLSSLPTASP